MPLKFYSLNDKMLLLVFSILRSSITKSYFVHLIINLVICSYILPWLTISSTQSLAQMDIDESIKTQLFLILIDIFVTLKSRFFSNRQEREFKSKVRNYVEELIRSKLIKLDWDLLRETTTNLNQLNETIRDGKIAIISFVTSLIQDNIKLLRFFFYCYRLWLISKWCVIFYLSLTITITILLQFKKENNDFQFNFTLYCKYSYWQGMLFTKVIHHEGTQVCDKIKDCKLKIDAQEEADSENWQNTIINYVIDFSNIVDLFFFGRSIQDLKTMLIYMHYARDIRNYILIISTLITKFKEAKQQYKKMSEFFLQLPEKQFVAQLSDYHTIQIEYLIYRNPKFLLRLQDTINIKSGYIIRLDGQSGHGKTTFMELLSGVKSKRRYKAQILIDNKPCTNKFDAITSLRLYMEQNENVSLSYSIAQAISGEIDKKDFSNHEVKRIMYALRMAECMDFVTTEKGDSKLRFIHDNQKGLSGGQKKRITVARLLYRAIKSKVKMLILDEIDNSLQADLALKIMRNVYNYCRSKSIICVVAAHTTEVKTELKYDLTIYFRNGQMTTTAPDD